MSTDFGLRRWRDSDESAPERAAEGVALLQHLRGHFEGELLPAAIDPEVQFAVAVAGDDALHVLEAFDGFPVDAGDQIAGLKAGRRCRHPRLNLADARRDRVNANREVHSRVDHEGKEKICGRSSEHHGRALPYGLSLKGAPPLLRRQARERLRGRLARGVLVVDEFHVAAERNPGDAPARALAIGEAADLLTETDGEGAHGDTAPARDEEMAELVDEDHDAEHDEEGDHGENCGHRCDQDRKH